MRLDAPAFREKRLDFDQRVSISAPPRCTAPSAKAMGTTVGPKPSHTARSSASHTLLLDPIGGLRSLFFGCAVLSDGSEFLPQIVNLLPEFLLLFCQCSALPHQFVNDRKQYSDPVRHAWNRTPIVPATLSHLQPVPYLLNGGVVGTFGGHQKVCPESPRPGRLTDESHCTKRGPPTTQPSVGLNFAFLFPLAADAPPIPAQHGRPCLES
jgi:hypothetical protein